MNELTKLHFIVGEMLVKFPETRDSDALLYVKICESINPIACNMPFAKVLLNRKDYGFPNYESVGRIRRKLQEHNPLLRADATVEDGRYENWKEYRAYALEE